MNKTMKVIICLMIFTGLVLLGARCWSFLESNDTRLIANTVSIFIVGIAVSGFGILWIKQD